MEKYDGIFHGYSFRRKLKVSRNWFCLLDLLGHSSLIILVRRNVKFDRQIMMWRSKSRNARANRAQMFISILLMRRVFIKVINHSMLSISGCREKSIFGTYREFIFLMYIFMFVCISLFFLLLSFVSDGLFISLLCTYLLDYSCSLLLHIINVVMVTFFSAVYLYSLYYWICNNLSSLNPLLLVERHIWLLYDLFTRTRLINLNRKFH